MGEATRRKRLGLGGNANEKVFRGPWLHGAKVRFETWLVPPPDDPSEALEVKHTAVFLTTHADFAEDVDRFVCETSLSESALVLVPAVASKSSEMMRQALLKHPLCKLAFWVRDAATWRKSWQTGEVMRFAAEIPVLEQLVERSAAAYKQLGFPDEAAEIAGKQALTRSWIEELVKAARGIGFDALQGHEIDRHSGGAPIARPWLAVFRAEVLDAPAWR